MEFAEYKEMVVGRVLTNLFFTQQDGPHDYMPGIPPAYYFSTVMELDHETKLCFGSDYIVEWVDETPLILLTNDNWLLPPKLVFKGQMIVDLTRDEYDQITFHLENGTTIDKTCDYGDQLFIEHPDITEVVAQQPQSALEEIRAWWRRVRGK